jgi:hypothetical protein
MYFKLPDDKSNSIFSRSTGSCFESQRSSNKRNTKVGNRKWTLFVNNLAIKYLLRSVNKHNKNENIVGLV